MAKKYTVRCKSLDHEGRGNVVFNNTAFSVPYLLPGEKAEISLVYGKEKIGARLETLLSKSPDRVEPVCPMYGSCGGCNLMHMSYEAQLTYKQQVAEEAICEALGCFDAKGKSAAAAGRCPEELTPIMEPILGMEGEALHYRNKIHSTFGREKGRPTLGLYRESTHQVVPVDSCAIEQEAVTAIRKTILKFVKERGISVYNEDSGRGVLRHLLFRVAGDGGVMVVIVVGQNVFPEKRILAEAIAVKHPEVRTVVLNYNLKKTTMVLGNREETLYGSGYLEDRIGECTFRLSPRSFYQVNLPQMERLYQKAVEYANLQPGDTALDAYCGIGTITLLLAKSQPQADVSGVELNADAVKDATMNAKRNQLDNVHFTCADAGEYLKGLAAAGKKLSVLVMDPPRSGSSESFLKACLTLQPERIVYVSCNPDTLARDAKILAKRYRIEKVQPVDMFPQTGHVETVVLMSRKDK